MQFDYSALLSEGADSFEAIVYMLKSYGVGRQSEFTVALVEDPMVLSLVAGAVALLII